MNNVFDLHHQVAQRLALAVGTNINTSTITLGIIIDTFGFTALEFFLLSDTVATDGIFTTILQHGDDSGLSDATTVPAAETLGSADYVNNDNNISRRMGYIGKKRYVRLAIVSTGLTAGSGSFTGVVALGGPNHQPVAD